MAPKKRIQVGIQKKITPAGKGSALLVSNRPQRNAAKSVDADFFGFYALEDESYGQKGEQLTFLTFNITSKVALVSIIYLQLHSYDTNKSY